MKKKAAFKLQSYNKRLKYVGTFVTKKIIQLKRYADGKEILVDTSTTPYSAIVRFPITFSEDTQRTFLKQANTLTKSLMADIITDREGKVKLRPYGAIRSDTVKIEKKLLKIMKYYYKLKQRRMKDIVCFRMIENRFSISEGAAKQKVERNKKRFNYLRIGGVR